jgi:hypothetical protein
LNCYEKTLATKNVKQILMPQKFYNIDSCLSINLVIYQRLIK